jgi:hypothetical protein
VLETIKSMMAGLAARMRLMGKQLELMTYLQSDPSRALEPLIEVSAFIKGVYCLFTS